LDALTDVLARARRHVEPRLAGAAAQGGDGPGPR
jgi:hypothetical protein